MLRGPQTAAELRARSERLHPFLSQEEVDRALRELEERELVELLPRRPGQKEQRYRQLLGEGGAEPPSDNLSLGASEAPRSALEERLAELEQRVAALEAALRER
jgi:uncharacterized protein YceH (UPF0502 family)